MKARTTVALTLAAAGLIAWGATRAWSAQKCVAGRQDCRTPKVCEIKAQILAKSAMQAVFADRASRAAAQAAAQREEPRGQYESAAAYEQRMRPFACEKLEQLAEHAMTAISGKLPACAGSAVKTAPGYKTDETCKITATSAGHEISDEDAQKVDTCEEFLDAARVHELYHQSRCNEVHRKGGARILQKLDECGDEEVKGYHLEMAYLFDEISFGKLKCTPSKAHVKFLRDTARRAATSLVAHGGGRK